MTKRDRALLSLVLVWFIRVTLSRTPLLSTELDCRADELIEALSKWGVGE